MIEIFGTISFITTLIGLFPQIYKTHVTKSAEDVSMILLINYLIGSVAWVVYGVLISDQIVIYANIVCLITAIISIAQKIRYGRRDGCYVSIQKSLDVF